MNHREVMQQALEAIRIFREWETGQDYESCRATVLARALAAEESLGAALAEFDAEPTKEEQTQIESKQEPVAWLIKWVNANDGVPQGEWQRGYDAARNVVRAHLKAAQQVVNQQMTTEPVAKVELMTTGGNAGLATRIVEIDDHLRERLRPGQMLYTHPPQRQPLTEYEAWEIWDALADRGKKGEDIVHAFARAIERAHGIGGQDDTR